MAKKVNDSIREVIDSEAADKRHYEGQRAARGTTVPDEGEYGNMNVGDFSDEHNSMAVRRKTEEHISG